MAEIIIKSDFVQAKTARIKKQSFSGVLEYNANPLKTEATRFIQEQDELLVDLAYNGMNKYMNNPEKSTGLFTRKLDNLTENQEMILAKVFNESQEKDGNMWRFVLSFENEALEKYGLYNGDTGQLNEMRMKHAIRIGMNDLIKRENFTDANFVWIGAIHYNTGNIHIHIAGVERLPTRERGMLKYESIEKIKSKVMNSLESRSDQLAKIDTLYRQNIVAKRRAISAIEYNQETLQMMAKLKEKLPLDKRKWKYNMNALQKVRPEIDRLNKQMIHAYFPNEYRAFKQTVEKEMANNQERYGEGNGERYKETLKNKEKALFELLGNATLKELAKYEKEHIVWVKDANGHVVQKREVRENGEVALIPMPSGNYFVEREKDIEKKLSDGVEVTISRAGIVDEKERKTVYRQSMTNLSERQKPMEKVLIKQGGKANLFVGSSEEIFLVELPNDQALDKREKWKEQKLTMNKEAFCEEKPAIFPWSGYHSVLKKAKKRKNEHKDRNKMLFHRPKEMYRQSPKVNLNRLKRAFSTELEEKQNQAVYNFHVEQSFSEER
ncbi:TPA: hypothetical protein IQB41_002465 [Listeria monocytogenes]|nr:hypothetical protein [Listeria monocytogenes]